MKDIMKIAKSLEECGLVIKDVSETIKNEAKEQNWGFLGTLLGSLHFITGYFFRKSVNG